MLSRHFELSNLTREAVLPSPGWSDSGWLGSAVPPVNPGIQVVLAAYRRVLEEHFGERLVQLTLFGSYARGEAHADSDVDVAVVLDRIERPSDRMLPMELAGELTISHNFVITPLITAISLMQSGSRYSRVARVNSSLLASLEHDHFGPGLASTGLPELIDEAETVELLQPVDPIRSPRRHPPAAVIGSQDTQ